MDYKREKREGILKKEIEEIEAMSEYLMCLFVQNFDLDKSQYVSFFDMFEIFEKDDRLQKDHSKIRSTIQATKRELKKIGLILINKRRVGYKIADKFEAMDEKEKAAIRMLKYQYKFQESYLNEELNLKDLENDNDRMSQHRTLIKLQNYALGYYSEAKAILQSSPFYRKNNQEVVMLEVDEIIKARSNSVDNSESDDNESHH